VLVAQYSLSQLLPAFARDRAVTRNLRLPYGGPAATGGKYAKGTVLGCVGGAAAAEVVTLTLGTGAHTVTITADKVYQITHAANVALATVQAQYEAIFGAGNVAVTGTVSTTHTLTFQNQLANARIGCLFAVASAGGSPSWARTTRGSCGAGQYEAYLDGTVDPAAAVLAVDYLSTPQGGLVGEGIPTGQAFSPPCYVAGYFNVADLTGLDANAAADAGWRLVTGDAITDTGAVVGLGI
jgi:hypothetical protein